MKTHEEYIAELKKINPHIIPIEEYKGSNIKIYHKCLIDGYEWMVRPGHLLEGTQCPECTRSKRRKTHEEYVSQVTTINPKIEVVETYKKDSIKILHRCKIDGCEWYAKPTNIIQGKGCPKCASLLKAKKRTKSHDKYVSEVKSVNSNISQ